MNAEAAPIRGDKWPRWSAYAIAAAGLAVYLVQSIVFAHTTISNLDEGAYLLKGILFASGKYQVFGPGISTNKGPLAFLIPGYVQLLFGAGLRTGRYLAVFFGTMAVVGAWIGARRLSGDWLAAAAVWVLALSPAVIKYYSNGATQSTIAFLLAWSLMLAVGKNRSAGELTFSGVLAGLMILVRQNMVAVLPLLTVYAFWQHGRKAIVLAVGGALIVLAAHIIYWPKIMSLWSWIPYIRLPPNVVYSAGGLGSWSPEMDWSARVLSVFQAVRFHYVALIGFALCLLLWPRMRSWNSPTEMRAGFFLIVLFFVLLVMHSMAAIGQDYCVYCFGPYVAFFNIAGILLTLLLVRQWNLQASPFIQIAVVVLLLLVFTGMGFSAFEDIGAFLLHLPAPRFRNLTILPGVVTWGEILSNRFHLDTNQSKRFASTVFGLFAGGGVILLAAIIWRRLRGKLSAVNFGSYLASACLVLGGVFSPILAGSAGQRDCATDVIAANERNGDYLSSLIPPDSLVYWDGGLSTAPLLYLPSVNIFAAQINDGYSFKAAGDIALLNEFGLWSEEMDAQWRATADFFIIEESRYASWQAWLTPDKFDEFSRSPAGTSCLANSRLRIFRKK